MINRNHDPTTALLRRNSTPTSTAPPPSSHPQPHHAHSFPNGTTKPPPPLIINDPNSSSLSSYTSLKDFLPGAASPTSSPAVNSPTAAALNSGYEISIRNRLVKQAASAYLQPMSASPGSAGSSCWTLFSSCFGFTSRHVVVSVTRVLDLVLRFVSFRSRR